MKVKINVPENLSEISLGQYQRFLKLNFEDTSKNSFVLQKMIEIFCNVDLKNVASIKFSYITEITNHLSSLFEQNCELINTMNLNKIKYGFIPNLDDMSLGEYIDLDNFFHDWNSIHKAMAVLYRPIKHEKNGKYIIEKYQNVDNAETMKDMPLNVVFGAKVFFYHLGIELLNLIPNYLEQAELTIQQRQHLEKSGTGIQAFMDYVGGYLPGSMK